MKRIICLLLVFCMMGCAAFGGNVTARAAEVKKEQAPRSIAIVLDNSGSMYVGANSRAWCRATYAIEVFAAMMNDHDTLSVYPMHEVTIDGEPYSMEHPVTVTGPQQASVVRKMYTPAAAATPIETIDAAYEGLQKKTGERWLIVLTDGTTFYEKGAELVHNTAERLNERLGRYGQEMNVLYLGIGAQAAMPAVPEEMPFTFFADKATSSEEVLSKLTAMCNQIFGRDTMPANHFSENRLDFDVSVSKLIAFVQGEEVSGVSLTDAQGNPAGTKKSEAETRYAEKGSGNYGGEVDKSLRGMMVTYTDCAPGSYSLNYSGTASDIQIYYEPDVDLVFTFTETNGQPVDPDALYEGDYSVSFGMQDNKTGKYTESDLLGNTKYTGHYFIDGKEYPIECSDKKGSCTVPLKMGNTFNADMTAEYLSGYSIYKDAKDFGWPGEGLSVAEKPAGKLELKISGGDSVYQLATLEEGTHFRADIIYDGRPLEGEELRKAEITWDPQLSGALLEKDFAKDHYEIILSHKDPQNPQATPTGEFRFPMQALYTPPGSGQTQSEPTEFGYAIEDKTVSVKLALFAPQKYYQISKINEGEAIRADLESRGKPLTDDQLERVKLETDCEGIGYTAEKLPGESAFLIHLNGKNDTGPGKYRIRCKAVLQDEIGRTGADTDTVSVKLGALALWLKWLIFSLIVLIVLILFLIILHIRALPKKLKASKRDSNMTVDGEDVTKNATFDGGINDGRLQVISKFGGKKSGLAMDVRPAKGSYIRTPQKKRAAEVASASVKKQGPATIQEATVGTVKYVLNEETHKLERVPKNDKPFLVRNGARITYSGLVQSNGEMKPFTVVTKLKCNKK